MNKQHQWNIWYFVGAFFLLMLFQSVWTTWRTVELIPYSQFLTLLSEGKIVEATVHQEQITGRLKEPINGRELFVTNRVEPALAEQLGKSGTSFTGTVQNTFLSTLLSWVMPVLVFGGIWYFVFRRFAEKQGMGGLINIGKSKARVLVQRGDQRPARGLEALVAVGLNGHHLRSGQDVTAGDVTQCAQFGILQGRIQGRSVQRSLLIIAEVVPAEVKPTPHYQGAVAPEKCGKSYRSPLIRLNLVRIHGVHERKE